MCDLFSNQINIFQPKYIHYQSNVWNGSMFLKGITYFAHKGKTITIVKMLL